MRLEFSTEFSGPLSYKRLAFSREASDTGSGCPHAHIRIVALRSSARGTMRFCLSFFFFFVFVFFFCFFFFFFFFFFFLGLSSAHQAPCSALI